MAYQFMPMYNIDYPVGVGQQNDSRDVMLVQLLFLAYDRARQFQHYVDSLYGRTQIMVPHGRFNHGMDNWIMAFQATNRSMPQDGKILPIPASGGTFVPITGGVSSTLAVLNYNALVAAPMAYRHIADRMQLVIKRNIPLSTMSPLAQQARSNPTAFGQGASQRGILPP
jgi:hypothetical protein